MAPTHDRHWIIAAVPNTSIRIQGSSRWSPDRRRDLQDRCSTALEKYLMPVQGRPHKAAFFGGSFMFGHGVENDQTLPYYFVRNSRGTFEGFNFAGEGWGPHQMLSEIETGFVRRVAVCPTWPSTRQSRITCAVSPVERLGRMGRSTNYAEMMQHAFRGHFIASRTGYGAGGSMRAGL